MRKKALILALLTIASALAGCIEDRDVDSDTTEEVGVDDGSGNVSTRDGRGTERVAIDAANPDDCSSGGGTWIEASERGEESYCDTGDGNESNETSELTQEDCERRGGTWFEERGACHFEEDRDDEREEDREITQEDCERRNGTWIVTADRAGDGYCDFGEDDREEEREERELHQMIVVYPDNSSERMLCRGCIGIDNMTVWNFTTTVLGERNISLNYSTHEVGHHVSGINGSDSPSDGSWYWTLYVWNETDAANASWQESRYGGEYTGFIEWSRGAGHIAWAPNTTNISDIPVPRIVVQTTEGDSEITQEDCERRGGTWTEAADREDVHYCDYEEEDRGDDPEEDREEDRDREEESEDVSR